MKSVALFANRVNPESWPYIKELIDELTFCEFKVVVCNKLFELCKNEFSRLNVSVILEKEIINQKIDIILSLGGDGTLLDAIQHIRASKIPILGINLGRLGFLASISKEEISEAVKCIKENDYTLVKRNLLSVVSENNLFGELNFALNELTLHKKDTASMITIHTKIDGLYLNSYWADGLIISTPTGSTAYSLSCGGPIVLANTDTFLITPIAPHNLNVRPIVISNKHKISLTVEGRGAQFLSSLDSRTTSIDIGVELIVTLCDFDILLIKPNKLDFFSTIRDKLYWGIDKRN